MLLGLLIMTRAPAKAQAEGLLPRIAAFVGTYLPWTIAFLGKTDQALPNLVSAAFVLTGIDHDARHGPTSGPVVQHRAAGAFSGEDRSLSMDQASALLLGRNRDRGRRAAMT